MHKSILTAAVVLVSIHIVHSARTQSKSSSDQALSDEEAMEIVQNHQGRVELAKLLADFEAGEIDEAEYERRAAEINAKYLGGESSEQQPLSPCDGITCATMSVCKVVDGKATCDCPEGYVSDLSDGSKCVASPPSPGWSRQAAISGLVAAPVALVLGMAAFGATVLDNPTASLAFRSADLAVIGLMGPWVAVGAGSARGSASAIGFPLLRLPAHAAYAVGTVGGLVDTLLYSQDNRRDEWPILLWSSAGTAAIMLHSIDAAVSYYQATGRDETSDRNASERPWMWTALVVGVGATVGSVATGLKTKALFDEVGDVSAAETLCEGMVLGGEAVECGVEGRVREALRWSAATNVLVGLAVAGWVTGGILYFVEPMLPCPKVFQDVSLAPFAGETGAGLMLGGRF